MPNLESRWPKALESQSPESHLRKLAAEIQVSTQNEIMLAKGVGESESRI